MDVDLIIVNYFSGSVLRQHLPALLKFAGESGLIISDNSPRDGTAEVVANLAPHARIVNNGDNIGFAAAVNRAIARSTADLVLLANPDIDAIEGSLSDVVEAFCGDSRLAAVGARVVDRAGAPVAGWQWCPGPLDVLLQTTPLWRLPGVRGWRSRARLPRHAARTPALCGAFLFLRRSALRDIGLLDERFFLYYEETDWLVRASQRGWTCAFLPGLSVVHEARTSVDPGVCSSHEKMLLRSQQSYLRKHFGSAAERLVRAALLLSALASVALAASRPSGCSEVRARWERLKVLASMGRP